MKLANEIGGLLKLEIASVRANLLPRVVLRGLAGAAGAAYYLLPGAGGAVSSVPDVPFLNRRQPESSVAVRAVASNRLSGFLRLYDWEKFMGLPHFRLISRHYYSEQ